MKKELMKDEKIMKKDAKKEMPKKKKK